VKHFYESVPGQFSFRDAYEWLASELKKSRGVVEVVEVGVLHGQSASYLAVELERRDVLARLYLVDIHFPEDLGLNLSPLLDLHGVVVQVQEGPSVEIAQRFRDGSLDAVFIDGDHGYAACAADIAAWRPKVRAGGIVAGHDYFLDDVRRAVTAAFERVSVWRGDRSVGDRYWGSWATYV
jgi:predicted O-methyltransferase YrrM